ncbi:MAG: diacylglycerol kinase family protein [Solirubrobacterales bacterium]
MATITTPSLAALERLASAAQRDAAVDRKRMLVVVNPYATTVSDRLRNLVVYALQGRYEVTAIDTESKDHATEVCRRVHDEGYDVVVTFGGDGTVNEAVNGLAGSEVPLFPLPGGNTNVFCRMLGIPSEIVDATEHLLRIADHWRPRRVDLPAVNGRAFTFASGIGLDATVVRRVDARPHLKARLGPWFFTSAAVASFLKDYLVHPPRLEVAADTGWRDRGVTAIVQNGDPYTYFRHRPISLAEGVTLDSGTMSAVVLERATALDLPTISARAFLPRARIVRHRRVGHVEGIGALTVRSADGREIPLQVDGDYVASVVEARYTITPGGLTVVT